MKIAKEFSKHALYYDSYNTIQKKVARKLIADMKSKPKNILDLGCGKGAVCNEISWKIDNFVGVDFAEAMLSSHPKSDAITCKRGNFDDTQLFEELKNEKFDYIISASALQWSVDIDKVLNSLSNFNLPISLAIFTCNTFKTLHKIANVQPLLLCSDDIKKIADRYFKVKYELVSYTLEFNSKHELFQYIKKSGVSGSRKILSYKQTRKLINEYPHNVLEFEVLFIHSV